MKELTRFRGCMVGVDLDNINKEVIDALIKKEVIFLEGDLTLIGFNKTNENSTDLRALFTFNNKLYSFNKDLLLDIFNYLKRKTEYPRTNFLPEYIEKKIYAEHNVKKTLKILRREHKNLINSIENWEDYKFFLVTNERNAYNDEISHFHEDQDENCWKGLIIHQIDCDKNIIKAFLSSTIIQTTVAEQHSNDTLLSKHHPLIKKWKHYSRVREYTRTISHKIHNIESENNETPIKLNKKVVNNDLDAVIYIDSLRKVKKDGAGSYSEEKINKYLDQLTDKYFNKKEQLDYLKELINLDDIEYGNLKSIELAGKISDISGRDIRNLRRCTPFITKKENTLTSSQKKEFKEAHTIRLKMMSLIRNVV